MIMKIFLKSKSLCDKDLPHTIKTKFNSKLFLLILLFSLVSKMQMAQCILSLPSIVCINANFYLNPMGVPWPGVFTGGGGGISNLAGAYYFSAAAAGVGGPYTITYTITTPYYCTTTANITVVAHLTITPAGTGSPLKYTMTSGTPISLSVLDVGSWSNFRWYENGFLVCTTSTCTANRMGTFTVFADGPCGNQEKAELEVVCDCSQGSLIYTLSPTFTTASGVTTLSDTGGLHTTTDYVLGGTVTIQKGAELVISNANIDMLKGTKIILEAGDGTTAGGKFTLNNGVCRLRGCDKWQGVIIDGNASYDRGLNRHGKFYSSADGCYISDAYIGVYSHTGGEVVIAKTAFLNNNTDIALMNYPSYDYHPEIRGDSFTGKNMHDNFASQFTLDGEYSYFSGSGNRSSFKQMIYLEDVKDFDIYDCTFTGNNFLDGSNNFKTNAIEISDANNINLGRQLSPSGNSLMIFTSFFNSGIYGRNVTNVVNNTTTYAQGANYMFDKYSFDEDVILDKAIDLDNCSTITLGYYQAYPFDANRFLGTMNYGSYVTNSTNVSQYENLFNVSAVNNNTGLGSNIGTGIYYNGCNNIEVTGSYMEDISYGGYFESCINSSNIYGNFLYGGYNGFHFKDCDDINIELNTFDGCTNYSMQYYGDGGTNSVITRNSFLNTNYGLIISPDQNPIGTGSSSNDNGTAMSVDITCNFFQNNTYAIIGSGDINDQGNGTYTNGNYFDGNNYWGLCWMDFDLSWFLWYKTIRTGSTPNAGVSQPNLTLNGTTITSGNSNFVPSTSFNEASCFPNFFIAYPEKTIKQYTGEPKISNTMVNNELTVSTQNINSTNRNIICYDALGRTYNLELISSENRIYKYNTSNLASGIYFISVNNAPFKFYKIQ